MMRFISIATISACIMIAFLACNNNPKAANTEVTAKATAAKPVPEEKRELAAKAIPDKVVVTYFHTDYRCHTCITMEELADAAIKSKFVNELNSGKLQWRTINTDREENKHFLKDYKLFTKSLIVSAMKDGKEIAWKNCDKIWEHVSSPEKYEAYVIAEIQAYLNGV